MFPYFTQPRPLSWASPGHFTVQDKTHMDWLVADLGSLHTLTLSSNPQKGTRTECLVASWKWSKIKFACMTLKQWCNSATGRGVFHGRYSGTRRRCKIRFHEWGTYLSPAVLCISLISFTKILKGKMFHAGTSSYDWIPVSPRPQFTVDKRVSFCYHFQFSYTFLNTFLMKRVHLI